MPPALPPTTTISLLLPLQYCGVRVIIVLLGTAFSARCLLPTTPVCPLFPFPVALPCVMHVKGREVPPPPVNAPNLEVKDVDTQAEVQSRAASMTLDAVIAELRRLVRRCSVMSACCF